MASQAANFEIRNSKFGWRTPAMRWGVCFVLMLGLRSGGVDAQQARTTEKSSVVQVTEWVKGAAIPLAGMDPSNDLTDMERLDAMVGDARIVAMGEATHGTREFFQLKHRMLEYLVEKKGFTILGIEANWPESLAINDYVVNEVGDAQSALDGLYFWTWNTEEVLDLLHWMRKYNEDPAHTKKVKFFGFDGQIARLAATNVMNYLAKVDPEEAKNAAKIFEPVSDLKKEKEAAKKSEVFWERQEDKLLAIENKFVSHKAAYVKASSEKEWTMAQHNLEITRQAAEIYSFKQKGNVSTRDRAMAKNVRWILEQEGPEAKIMLWAHNGHVSAGQLGGGASMGNQLRQMYGKDMVVCGFSFDEGSFQALEKGRGLRQFTVGPASGDTLDGVLAATGIPLFAVDLRSAPADSAVAKWLESPQRMRSVGALYSENARDGGFVEVKPRDFDVLFFVQKTSAAHENPKGAESETHGSR
ncbi:MAG TPA: erythromycin esterase family protein [Dongiaceae bacterium]|nr:erythromycin esterase family protein [Dongiaceae bacterium]